MLPLTSSNFSLTLIWQNSNKIHRLTDIVYIKEGNLKLTDAGRAILEASISERKDIFRSQLLKDIFFKELMDTIVRHEGRMPKKDAMNSLSQNSIRGAYWIQSR